MRNMMIKLFRKYSSDNLRPLFYQQRDTMFFTLFPAGLDQQIPPHRNQMPETETIKAFLQHFPLEPDTLDSMLQLKLAYDRACPQFFPGRSMRKSGSIISLKFIDQFKSDSEIITSYIL